METCHHRSGKRSIVTPTSFSTFVFAQFCLKFFHHFYFGWRQYISVQSIFQMFALHAHKWLFPTCPQLKIPSTATIVTQSVVELLAGTTPCSNMGISFEMLFTFLLVDVISSPVNIFQFKSIFKCLLSMPPIETSVNANNCDTKCC